LFWTARNQLTDITGTVAASFLHDGLGRRKLRTVNGITENYLYDGLDAVLAKDGAGNVTVRYPRDLAQFSPGFFTNA
jgi:uncharacterized protein RhaS with RHS repeats